ncbi:MAG TPA: hypothetical protein PKA63_08690 [Oligoflexia bacterium]|nr:hypothetical protein [Oligoflexia bacterium]HMP48728.1 hypothetical protein [Oligoflexia bacterium]
MKLTQDLKEFVELLISENVQYLVIGGWAYNRFSEPRFTGDVDFFISTNNLNQIALRRALVRFGLEQYLPPENNPLFEKKILMFGRPPHRIDLISEIDGVTFDEAWNEKEEDFIDGLKIFFISKRLLIKNKKAAKRDKDLLDVKNLESD